MRVCRCLSRHVGHWSTCRQDSVRYAVCEMRLHQQSLQEDERQGIQPAGNESSSADSGHRFAELAARLYSDEPDWLAARAHGTSP